MNINKALAEAITKGTAKAARKPIAALRRDVAGLKEMEAGSYRDKRTDA